MPLPSPMKDPLTLRALLRQRLKEINRSAEDLALAAQVPSQYVDDREAPESVGKGHRADAA